MVDVSRGTSDGYGATAAIYSVAPLRRENAIGHSAGMLLGTLRENLCQSRGGDLARRWDGNGGGTAPRTSRDGTHARPSGSNVSTTPVQRRIYGDRIPLAFSNGMASRWLDQPEPVFTATEDWERGSVYEPNVLYHDGKWKMWYVAGSNQHDYLVQGYAESEDGAMVGASTLFLRRRR